MIEVSSRIDAHADEPGGLILRIQAHPGADQEIREELLDTGPLGVALARTDSGRLARISMERGDCTVRYRALVDVRREAPARSCPPAFEDLDLDLVEWTAPSRYCPSDRLHPVATELFGDADREGLVERVVAWVHDHLEYVPGASGELTAADATLLQREGVCRDYAHLVIALLRPLGVAARAVAVYSPGADPPDFHMLAEVHGGTSWGMYDATAMARPEEAVRIATGRDAADIAWGTTAGGVATDPPEVSARVIPPSRAAP